MKYAFKKAVKTHPPPSLDYQLKLNWSDLSTNLDYCIHLAVPCQLASSYLNFNCFFSSVYLALSSVSPPPPLPSTGHTHVLRTPTIVTPFSTPYSTYLLPPPFLLQVGDMRRMGRRVRTTEGQHQLDKSDGCRLRDGRAAHKQAKAELDARLHKHTGHGTEDQED